MNTHREFSIALAKMVAAQQPGAPTAWIFGASVNGLSFVRSLARRGVPTVLLDSDRLPGAYSSLATFVRLPPVEQEPQMWLDLLCKAAEKYQERPVAFITSDVHGLFFAEHESLLNPWIRFLIPNREAFESIVDKQRQYELARRVGVPIPETHFPEHEAEVRSLASRIPYPCILKPYQSHIGKEKLMGKKVVRIENEETLLRWYVSLEDSGVPFMIQEVIPGGDDALFGYLAFWDHQGNELAWLTKQKLRQNPPLYGDGSLQKTVELPELRELSCQLLKGFHYRGFVGVEFKRDPRDGLLKLMEINPRTVSGNQLAISAGIDFPFIGYRYLTGQPLTPEQLGPFQVDVKYLNEEWDLKAFLALRREGKLGFGEWIRSIRGARAKALWALDDPKPALAVLWRVLRAAFCGRSSPAIEQKGLRHAPTQAEDESNSNEDKDQQQCVE